jgi:hypothetical protein
MITDAGRRGDRRLTEGGLGYRSITSTAVYTALARELLVARREG